jgi:phenylalanyl-tRNA synthetase alpha subunit
MSDTRSLYDDICSKNKIETHNALRNNASFITNDVIKQLNNNIGKTLNINGINFPYTAKKKKNKTHFCCKIQCEHNNIFHDFIYHDVHGNPIHLATINFRLIRNSKNRQFEKSILAYYMEDGIYDKYRYETTYDIINDKIIKYYKHFGKITFWSDNNTNYVNIKNQYIYNIKFNDFNNYPESIEISKPGYNNEYNVKELIKTNTYKLFCNNYQLPPLLLKRDFTNIKKPFSYKSSLSDFFSIKTRNINNNDLNLFKGLPIPSSYISKAA